MEQVRFVSVIKSFARILNIFVFFFPPQVILLLLRLLEIMQSTSFRRGTLVARLEILIFFKLTDLFARFVAALRLHERAPKRCLPGRITSRLFSVALSGDEIIPPPFRRARKRVSRIEIKARDKADSKSQLIKSLTTRVSFITAATTLGMFKYFERVFKN